MLIVLLINQMLVVRRGLWHRFLHLLILLIGLAVGHALLDIEVGQLAPVPRATLVYV